jgi:hypothetical protein
MMMQFIYDGNFYKAIRVTGPKHNLLGLSFGDIDINAEIVALEIANGEVESVEANDVMEQVKAGVANANMELGVDYKIVSIQYVPSDSPSKTVYAELAKEIVKRLANKNEFVRV